MDESRVREMVQVIAAGGAAPSGLRIETLRRARRARALLVAGAATLVVLLGATAVFGSIAVMGDGSNEGGLRPVAPPSASAGRATPVALVVCDDSGAVAVTPLVATSPAGVRVQIVNHGASHRFFEIEVDTGDPSSGYGSYGPNEGGRLRHDKETFPSPLPPGRWSLGCFKGKDIPYGETQDPRFAHFDVIDPRHLYLSSDLDCSSQVRRHVSTGVNESDLDYAAAPSRFAEVARSSLPGIMQSDSVEKPGYPKADWKLPTMRVERDGRVVALLIFLSKHRLGHYIWMIQVRECPGLNLEE